MVKIVMMVAADYAAVEPLTGKLNILGVFRNIAVNEFPATHRRMYLVVKIAGEYDRSNRQNTLTLSVNDSTDNEILRIESSFALSAETTGISPEHNSLFELNGLVFTSPGEYSFTASLNDGEAQGELEVHVLQREA